MEACGHPLSGGDQPTLGSTSGCGCAGQLVSIVIQVSSQHLSGANNPHWLYRPEVLAGVCMRLITSHQFLDMTVLPTVTASMQHALIAAGSRPVSSAVSATYQSHWTHVQPNVLVSTLGGWAVAAARMVRTQRLVQAACRLRGKI